MSARKSERLLNLLITLLVSRGASPDQAKSPLNVSDPEAVREVHEDYVDSGARIITTNTWDANRVKLTTHEWSDSLEKINRDPRRTLESHTNWERPRAIFRLGNLAVDTLGGRERACRVRLGLGVAVQAVLAVGHGAAHLRGDARCGGVGCLERLA